MSLNERGFQQNRQTLEAVEPHSQIFKNPLTLVTCPFKVSTNQRQRFILRGDATQPVTGIEIAKDLSSRYQIPTAADTPVQTPFRLNVLHFNDLHGRISHVADSRNAPVFSRLVSRYKHQLKKYRNNPQGGVLLLSAGDDMVGTPFDILMADQAHPYSLYQELGVDAAALGNHDLDLGVATLGNILQRSENFPVLSANLVVPPALQPCVAPAALIDVKGVRVGIIGLTTSAQMKNAEAKQLQFADPVAVVKNLLSVLRPYFHVLIVLSHLGYDLHATSATVEGYGDRQLAEALPYGAVDAIIGGHTHHILNERGLNPKHIVNGIPIAQAGAMGRFIGELTFTLDQNQTVTVTNSRLTSTADLPVDSAFEQEHIMPIVTALNQKLTEPLGQVEEHPDLDVDAVRNDFASRELAIANFVTAGMVTQARKLGHEVDFAMTDSAIFHAGLTAGPLTYADWFAVMPYADTLSLFQLTGVQLQQLLLDNAHRVNYPREPHLERGFLQFSDLVRYKIQRGKHRYKAQISDIFVGDRPLQDQLDQTFSVVSHSFLREISGHWSTTAQEQGLPLVSLKTLPCQSTSICIRDELIAYTKAQGGVSPSGGAKIDGRLLITD